MTDLEIGLKELNDITGAARSPMRDVPTLDSFEECQSPMEDRRGPVPLVAEWLSSALQFVSGCAKARQGSKIAKRPNISSETGADGSNQTNGQNGAPGISRPSSPIGGSAASNTSTTDILLGQLANLFKPTSPRGREPAKVPLSPSEQSLDGVPQYFGGKKYRLHFDHCLGQGATGRVFVASRVRETSQQKSEDEEERFAVKIIDLETVTEEIRNRVSKEITILSKLSQKHLHQIEFVKFYDSFREGRFLFLVFEWVQGNDLCELIQMYPNGLDESLARQIMKAVCIGVYKLHRLGIAHLDLKLENIMVDNEGSSIRLLDFGLAEELTMKDDTRLLNKGCGSLNYVPPEMLQPGSFCGFKCDTWSLGIIAYALLKTEFPFSNSEDEDTYSDICNKKFHDSSWQKGISREGVDFVESLLELDPLKRLSMEELVNHKWITGANEL